MLVAVALGVLFGIVDPANAKEMKLLGDIFIRLIKMVIGPVIFLTIILGIANIADMKKVGRVGSKAILYFEIVTTFALGIGLAVVNFTKPGAGLDVSTMAKGDISSFTAKGKAMTFSDFVVHIVPESVIRSLAEGGLKTLLPLLRLMGDVYLTMFLFIFVVLNLITKWYGFSLWQFLKYIRAELLIVLGTSSSEAGLPGLMAKLERYGCARPV